jgi:D-glycero-D-manno-heptose 1,7-bisphosphate phosphatase
MKKAVFMDRDAVLNEARPGGKQPLSPLTCEEFRPIQSAERGLRLLKELGFVLIATTHQPGLSRGYQFRRELDRMHDMLRRLFPLDDIMVCPHDDGDHCPCRRPRPGLLIESAFKWQLNLDGSFVISDRWQDAEAARTAGCTSLLVKAPWNGNVHHDFVLESFDAVVGKIAQLNQQFEYA